jgi:cysteine-rich repeat protein
MWGGLQNTTVLPEMWEWNGTNWHQLPQVGFLPTGQAYPAFILDGGRHELFTFSGWQAYGTTSGEAWSQSADIGRRPGVVAVMSVGSAGIGNADIETMQVHAVARGVGEAPGSGLPTYGAELLWWNERDRDWDLAAASLEAGDVPSDLSALESNHSGAARHVRSNGTVQFLVESIGGSGRQLTGASTLLDNLELAVTYRLGSTHACGDGTLDPGEACDDGDAADTGNGCSAACQRTGFCGDGALQPLFEACEPPNSASCSAACATRTEACCEANDAAGCLAGGSASISACVCTVDPYCCDARWDQHCVELIEVLGCGGC